MRHIVLFLFSLGLFPTDVVLLAGGPATTVTQRLDSSSVKEVRVYDCRNYDGFVTERFLKVVHVQGKVEQIFELLRRYERGWKPVRGTVATGHLRLDFIGKNDSGKSNSPIAQFRLSPNSIVTYISGKPYLQEMPRADQKRICHIIGLEEAFFSKASGGSEGSRTESKAGAGADVATKYVAFARSLLNSPDKFIRAEALDVVLSSYPSDGVELARKSLEGCARKLPKDIQDPVCLAALDYLAGRADRECLLAIRELLTKHAHPKNARGYLNLVASQAAEVLLRSNDQDARKQAIDWIESFLADPDELGMWELATTLVGKYRLSQLKAHLTGSKIQGDQKGTAAAALAKLGDVPAQRYLREKFTDPRFFYFIVSDLGLVALLRLSPKDIENAVLPEKRAELTKHIPVPINSDTYLDMDETAMARACAYLGHPERLRRLAGQLRELSRANTVRSNCKLTIIVSAIKDVGDKSMIPTLEEFFAATTDELQKLETSSAIVRIMQREKARPLPAVPSPDKPSP